MYHIKHFDSIDSWVYPGDFIIPAGISSEIRGSVMKFIEDTLRSLPGYSSTKVGDILICKLVHFIGHVVLGTEFEILFSDFSRGI